MSENNSVKETSEIEFKYYLVPVSAMEEVAQLVTNFQENHSAIANYKLWKFLEAVIPEIAVDQYAYKTNDDIKNSPDLSLDVTNSTRFVVISKPKKVN